MSRRRRLAFALAALLAGALVWGAGPAAAYWTTTGAGVGDAGTSDLSPAAIDAPGASAGTTTITWTDQAELSDDPAAGRITYVVQRDLGGGAYVAIAGGGACAGAIARPATSCTDTVAVTGSYSYRVVASLATWTAVSNAVAVSVNTDTSYPTASITRITASPTNVASLQWRVSFSEPVTGVDATDLALVTGGAVSGAAITSVTGSSATYTVTVNAGSGDGTIALNLVDDDSIRDAAANPLGGAGNGSVTGPVDTIDRTAPALTTLQMLDTNADGKVNSIRATFNESVASTTLKTNWTLTGVPSGGSLSSVARSGAIVTLTLTQGAGAADTSVGLFKIALAAAATGVRDAAGNQASFAAQEPADLAKPVLIGVTDTDVGTDGLMSQETRWLAVLGGDQAVDGGAGAEGHRGAAHDRQRDARHPERAQHHDRHGQSRLPEHGRQVGRVQRHRRGQRRGRDGDRRRLHRRLHLPVGAGGGPDDVDEALDGAHRSPREHRGEPGEHAGRDEAVLTLRAWRCRRRCCAGRSGTGSARRSRGRP